MILIPENPICMSHHTHMHVTSPPHMRLSGQPKYGSYNEESELGSDSSSDDRAVEQYYSMCIGTSTVFRLFNINNSKHLPS